MKECCEQSIRKAAEQVSGTVPHPLALHSEENAKRFEPIVRWLFIARDSVLCLIPSEKEKQDKKREAQRLERKRRRDSSRDETED